MRRLAPALVLALAACGGPEPLAPGGPRGSGTTPPITAQSRLLADVGFSPEGVEVFSVTPTTLPPSSLETGDLVRWELRGDDGAVIEAGTARDPRIGVSEGLEDGELHGGELTLDRGVLTLSLPEVDGVLAILEADGAEIATGTFAPGALRQGLYAAGSLARRTNVRDNGRHGESLNVLFLPDGFTAAQKPQFEAAVRRAADELLAIHGYLEHADQINVWYRWAPSRVAGAPAARPTDTAFESEKWGDSLILTNRGNAEARRLIREEGASVAVVLVNGTGRAAAFREVIVQEATDGGLVLGHELGHAVFGLADEYAPPSEADGCDLEEPGKNAARYPAIGSLPRSWGGMVRPGTQLPTVSCEQPDANGDGFKECAAPTAEQASLVGAFEGARLCPNKLFRPQASCRMRDGHSEFCEVCRYHLDRHFANLKARRPIPSVEVAAPDSAEKCPESRNLDGVCDWCLAIDYDCDTYTEDVCGGEDWRGDGLCDPCLGDGMYGVGGDMDCAANHDLRIKLAYGGDQLPNGRNLDLDLGLGFEDPEGQVSWIVSRDQLVTTLPEKDFDFLGVSFARVDCAGCEEELIVRDPRAGTWKVFVTDYENADGATDDCHLALSIPTVEVITRGASTQHIPPIAGAPCNRWDVVELDVDARGKVTATREVKTLSNDDLHP